MSSAFPLSVTRRLLMAMVTIASGLGVGFAQEIVPSTLILAEGDVPPGGDEQPVDELNTPFTNGLGRVGFVGELETEFGTQDSFIWIDDQIVWKNSDAPALLLAGGSERTMGISDSGGFVYSTTSMDIDVLLTHLGFLAREDEPAPGFPPEALSTFHTEPTMTPDGTVHWIAGVDLDGFGGTDGQALYTSQGTPASTELVLAFGDLVEGIPIQDDIGVGFDYQRSSNGHHIHLLLLETGDDGTDLVVYVDGSIAAQEGSPTGQGDLWENFDLVSINSSGHSLFSGNTDGPSETSEFVAFDGSIVLREGDSLDGRVLTGSARVRGLSLNELGQSALLWEYDGTETLFFACDAGDPLGSAVAIVSVDDELDFDDDGVGDATVTDFNASEILGPGLSLAEDGFLHAEVDLDDGTDSFEAIARFTLPQCPQSAPVLTLSGSCPDSTTLTISGATPGGELALLTGSGPGATTIPAGPCVGVETGLDELSLLARFPADPSGMFEITRALPPAACGTILQALDLASCLVTGVDTVPRASE